MKSQGTKETQGINGDAAALQRQMDVALAALLDGELAPCAIASHRLFKTDWRLTAEHPARCGICHPPARGLEVERVEIRETSATSEAIA